MTIHADVLSRMYSQIVQGKAKEESTLAATDDEHGQAWDTIAAEVETLRGEGVMFEIPYDSADTVTDLFASMRSGEAAADEEPEPESDEEPEEDTDE